MNMYYILIRKKERFLKSPLEALTPLTSSVPILMSSHPYPHTPLHKRKAFLIKVPHGFPSPTSLQRNILRRYIKGRVCVRVRAFVWREGENHCIKKEKTHHRKEEPDEPERAASVNCGRVPSRQRQQ